MISPEVLSLLDVALLHVGGGCQDQEDLETESPGGSPKEAFWESRAQYHHEHYQEFVRLFTAFHVAIARHKSGMLPEGPQQQPAFGRKFCLGPWHVEWECPHPDCVRTSPWPFRDADRTAVAQHIAAHLGEVALVPRRLVLSGAGVATTAFKNAASAATQARAAAQSRSSLAPSSSRLDAPVTDRGGKVAQSHKSLATSRSKLDTRVRDQGGNPASGMSAKAPRKVAPPPPQAAANNKGADAAAAAASAATQEKAARAAASKELNDQEDAERFMRQPHVRPAGMCTFYKKRCVSALTPCFHCDICLDTYHHACSAQRDKHDEGTCPCTIGARPA
jgi:hypothetical protein